MTQENGADMTDKEEIVANLRDVFEGWGEFLAGLSEEQITARNLPSDLSIKDVVGHLRAWQQVSNARLEAALNNGEPDFGRWGEGLEPDADENLERINAWIHQTYHDRPWPAVYRDWREGFLKLLELAAAIPEKDLVENGRYSWLGDYALSEVLEGTHEHHTEHLQEIASHRETVRP
jgi:hypothetical protein